MAVYRRPQRASAWPTPGVTPAGQLRGSRVGKEESLASLIHKTMTGAERAAKEDRVKRPVMTPEKLAANREAGLVLRPEGSAFHQLRQLHGMLPKLNAERRNDPQEQAKNFQK